MQVVPAYLEIAFFDVFVASAGFGFVVLEPPFVFFLVVVVSEMDACEYEGGVVF